MNYYVVLGIDEDADPDTIRSAFRGLVRRYHPDAGEGSSSEAFRRVVEAYETLNDPARRLAYDRTLPRHRVRPPQTREPIIEPLSNRGPAEPIAFTRSTSVGGRRPMDFVHWQSDVDELFEELLRSFDLGFWSVRPRSRHF
jgi:DnaJ-class molecular chaperone